MFVLGSSMSQLAQGFYSLQGLHFLVEVSYNGRVISVS